MDLSSHQKSRPPTVLDNGDGDGDDKDEDEDEDEDDDDSAGGNGALKRNPRAPR